MSSLFNNGKLHIKKRNFPEWMIFVILLFPFVYGFLTQVLPLPGAIRFSLDAIIVFLFVGFFIKNRFTIKRNVLPLFVLIALFFTYTLIVYAINFQSPFYYVWGVRNLFRFYAAFLIFVSFLDEDYANVLLKWLDVLFFLNAIVSVFQFFVLGVRQDFLGGLFGVSGGTNGYTLIFFTIVICKSLLSTFNGTENPVLCICKCIVSLLIAAMAEMKFYFFAFILILALTSVFTRLTKRKLIILIGASLAVVVGSALLTYIFGSWESFLTWESFVHYATKEHYSSQKDLNRLSAIPTLMEHYVTEPARQIFGFGLGNCDTSQISIFNSVFYRQYSYLNYTWLTSAMLFLETGFVGLILYALFFVVCVVYCFQKLKRNTGNRLFCQMGIIISIFSLVLMFYNSTLRIEAAYVIYFVLSLPFLSSKQEVPIAK